jgi:hypothetical protein
MLLPWGECLVSWRRCRLLGVEVTGVVVLELFRVGRRGRGQVLYSARRRPRRLPKGVRMFDF